MTHRRTASSIAAVLLFAALLTGCVPAKQDPVDIVGEWFCDNPSGTVCVLEIEADGSVEVSGAPRAMMGTGLTIERENTVAARGVWEAADLPYATDPAFDFRFADMNLQTMAYVSDGDLLFPVNPDADVYVIFHRKH